MPKISIIVPNYNHATFLKERLDSIFNQTVQDFEVILLDDASTDNSVEILKEYAKDDRVSHLIINQKNTGSPFKQWKKGLKLAKGRYIWIAESDDSCKLNFLETQLQHLKNASLSVAKINTIQHKRLTQEVMLHSVFKNQSSVTLTASHFTFNCPLFNVSSMVFKAIPENQLKTATFYKFDIIGDMVFYYEFFLNKKINYNQNTISYYRQHDKGVSTTHTKSLTYYKKYFFENVRFINTVFNQNPNLNLYLRNKFIKRRYNKIKNRITFKQKLTASFFTIYIAYLRQNFIK